jgi:hypothetical protein
MRSNKIFTVNFKIGEKLRFVFMLAGIIVLLPFALGSEDLQITSYYPVYYGSYDNIIVSDFMQLGGTALNDRTEVGNLSSGIVGIEAFKNDAYFIADNVMRIGTESADDEINFATGNLIRKFCVWTSWSGTGTQCADLDDGVSRWQPIMLGKYISIGTFHTYYNSIGEHSGTGLGKHVGMNNRVLCCRLDAGR